MQYIIGFAAGQVLTILLLYMGYNWQQLKGDLDNE